MHPAVTVKFSLLKQSSPHFPPHPHHTAQLIISSGIKLLASAVAMTTVGLHLPWVNSVSFRRGNGSCWFHKSQGVNQCLPVWRENFLFTPPLAFSGQASAQLPSQINCLLAFNKENEKFSDKNAKSLLACHKSIH